MKGIKVWKEFRKRQQVEKFNRETLLIARGMALALQYQCESDWIMSVSEKYFQRLVQKYNDFLWARFLQDVEYHAYQIMIVEWIDGLEFRILKNGKPLTDQDL